MRRFWPVLYIYHLGLVAHLDDAAGVVGDGAEGVHGEHVDGRGEHAHRRHRGAEETSPGQRATADVVGRQDGGSDGDGRAACGLEPDCDARDDVGALVGMAIVSIARDDVGAR